MSNSSFTFRGLMAPVFTPFYEDKELNLKIIPKYAEYLHSNDIHGVLVNGTTGEGVSMTKKERKQVLHAWVNACKPLNQYIMVQIGGTNMKDIRSLAKDAEEFNVSSILCLPDLFFKPSNVNDLVRYLKLISDAAPTTPLFYYHIPSYTGIDISMPELFEKGMEIPTLAGIKFTDTDLEKGTLCVSPRFSHYTVFLGCDTLLLPALLQGFHSAIGTTINIFPKENNAILRSFQEGDFKKSTQEQKKLNQKIEIIKAEGSWVSSMKAAMRLLTPIDVGPVRDPLLETNFTEIKINEMKIENW